MAQVNQLVVVAKRVLAAKKQTVSLIDKLFSLYVISRRNGKGMLQKPTTPSKFEPVPKWGTAHFLLIYEQP